MKRIDDFSKILALSSVGFGLCVISSRFHVGNNAFLAFALAGAFLMHMRSGPPLGERLSTVLVGAIFCAVYLMFGSRIGAFFGAPLVGGAAFLGEASLVVLLARALWCEDDARRRSYVAVLKPGAALAAFVAVAALCLMVTDLLHPRTYDLILYAFDGTLGAQPSFLLGRLFAACKPLENLGLIVYEGLPLAVAFLYAAHAGRKVGSGVDILVVFTTAGIAGFFLYQLFPAVGPVHVFPNLFPDHAPPVSHLAIGPVPVGPAPRNAMPSLHAAWALLLWWNSKGASRAVQVAALFILVITLMVTLGSGEHYLVDLVVAAPFSLAVQAACTTAIPLGDAARRRSLVGGAVITTAWLVALRFGIGYFQRWPVLSWASVTFTLLASGLLAHGLLRITAFALPEPRIRSAGEIAPMFYARSSNRAESP